MFSEFLSHEVLNFSGLIFYAIAKIAFITARIIASLGNILTDLLPDDISSMGIKENNPDLHREKGWRSGESTRLPPMLPRFDSRTRCHTWSEFVGSLLFSQRFFSGYSSFSLSSKTIICHCDVLRFRR